MHDQYIAAGTSRNNGKMYMHYSDYYGKEYALIRAGHQDVNIVILPEPMTKGEVIIALRNDPNFSDLETMELFKTEMEKVEGYEMRIGRDVEMEAF